MKKVTIFFTFLLLASFAFSQPKINDGSFESLTWPPDGWTIIPEWGDGAWQIDDGTYFGPGSAYDGTYAAMFDNYDYASGVAGSMITNPFELSDLLFPTLSFYWWNNDVSSSPSELEIYVFDGTSYTLLEAIDTYGSGETTWVNFSMVIPSNTTKIKFTGISDYGVLNTFVDKITLLEAAPIITTLELEQTTDLLNWEPLGGSYPGGFTMDVDKLVAKYYLNFATTTATNVPLMEDYFGFYLNTYPSDFFAYWAEKGVVEGAGGWQAVMWEIINGNTPIFYAKVTNAKAQSVMLVDGLRYQLGQPDVYLNFDGYFPDGDYTFTGKIANSEGTESELLSIPITLTDITDYPEFTVVELKKSTLIPIWSTIAGDLESGFSLQLDPAIPYYYFDFTTETATDMPIAEYYYPFLLKTDNLPAGYYDYWTAKGVFEGCTGTWEPTMWEIISGQQPLFFIKVFAKKDVGQAFMLVDGLQKLLGQPDDYLRVNGTYPLGTYDFEGTITSDQGIVSLPVEVSMTFLPLPFTLPFCENWDSMDFSTNYWTLDPAVGGAWSVTGEIGNPAPTALFYWDPQQIDYENMLSSYELDGTGIADKIFVKFDIFLSNYDSYTTEWLSANIFDGTTWHEVGYWDNQNGDIPWTTEVLDISTYALGNIFKVAFIAGGEDSYNINYWFVDNICVFQPAQVTGIVTELATGDPIGGAEVTFDNLAPATTLPDGTYEKWVMEGPYDVTASAAGYNPLTLVAQVVVLGSTNTFDFALTAPTMTVNPDELSDVLWYGDTSTHDIVITNDGDGPLTWNAVVTVVAKKSYSVNVPLTTTDKNPDSNGGIEKLPQSTTDAMFDLQFAFDVNTPTGQVALAGAETDGNYFYAPRWNGAQIYKFDLAGNYISSFTIPGVTSIRDLAFDGTYFYGGAASNRIYQMDFNSNTLVSTIVTPAALGGVRAIAFDFVYDAFWYNNFNTTLVLVNKAGTQLNSINSGTSIYGLAYDDLTSNGPYLWLFAGTSTGGGCAVLQYDIATKLFTGVGHVVSNDFPGAIAGGLFLHENLVSGTYTLGGILQGTPDVLFGYELGLIPIKWAYLSETSGVVVADVKESQTIQLTFDAGMAVPGIYEGQVIFTSDPDVGTETVNLTLEILGQEIMIPAANQWGLISTYYNMDFGPKPFEPTLENLLSEIKDNMVIMIGEDGIYWPGQNINTFPGGLWNNDFAYKIKMTANDDLVFTGEPIIDKTVTYGPGVHYVPVLSEVDVSVADVLTPHGTNIIFAFDLAEGLIYWPPYITTLTTLKPGFGYLVKFAATTTLNFDTNKAAGSSSISHEFENNTPWNNVTKTGDVHLIGIEAAAASELAAGDVIGVFNNAGICSGMTEYYGAGTSAFAVYGNDETTELNDGLEQDEMMFIRIFRNGEVFETTPVYSPEMPNSNGNFAINGLSVIESFKAGALSVGTDPISAVRIYPNPSSGMFTINLAGISNPVEMSVTNAQGQLIYSNQVEGSMQLDLTDQPNGVYFIRLVNENSVRLEKLIIK